MTSSGQQQPEDGDRDWLRDAKYQQAEVRANLMRRLFGPAEDDDQADPGKPDDARPDAGPDAA